MTAQPGRSGGAASIGKVKAGELVNFFAQPGGGKADMAMAGGTTRAS